MAEATKRGLFYHKTCICHYCKGKTEGYRILPMSRIKIEKWDTHFDFPYYPPTDAGGNFSNFLLVEVRVCSGCFFASNDDGQFITERSGNAEPWVPDAAERAAVQAQADTRRRIAAAATNLQAFPRSTADALVAYALGIHSATTLLKTGRNNPIEAVRLGNYALKCGHLCELAEQHDRVNVWRKGAMEYFNTAFGLDIKGPTLYRTLYQLGALGIFFNEDVIASRAFDYLSKLADKEPSRDLTRYTERLRNIWQDRDLHRMKA